MRLYLKSRCWSPRKSRIFLAALLFFFCLSFPAHDRPMAQEAKKILVIYSYHPVFPWTSLWRTGFEEELQKQISRLEIGVQVFDEYMDSVRFKNNEPYFKTYLQSKYQNRNLDLILAVSTMAASFVVGYRHELFPSLPLLIFTDEPWLQHHQIPEKASLVLSNKVSIETNIELILKLHPRTRKIVFVTGTSSESQGRKELAEQAIQDYKDRLEIHFMDDLELEEMLKQISSLPKDAVILYDIFARDSAGRWYVPAKVLEKMARVSSVPIYGLWDSLLGHGMVGGYLVSAELSGKAIAQTAVKMLKGNILPQGIMADQKLVSYMFDHGQLKRWGIDDRDLPPGSVVKFRSYTIWEQYRWHILGTLFLVVLQSLFVLYLLAAKTRRVQAEKLLRKAHEELETLVEVWTTELQHEINERKQAESHIRTLNQQLMKAQESERQRISRDLHDHIAQDLSTLKIGCETLFDKQPEVPNGIRQRISDFSKILQDCIHAIRDLAYDLRPPALDEIGLVQTVFQYCKDFSEKNGLKVDFISAGMDSLNLDFDIEINLYRLIQESFNNIKKHAEASWVTVKMTASSPNIILRIEDSGKGFNVAERMAAAHNQKRMGIRSMQERVSLLNGRMRIQSHPGNGTQIVIEVPCKEKNNDSEETNIDCR